MSLFIKNKINTKVLTISIAAYNSEKYLSACLDSVTNTACIDLLDIIVVDDGSSDNTCKIADDFNKKYPNSITVISKKNGGWGSTINTSIEFAKGKYFKVLDSDDKFRSENIKDFIEYLSDCDTDIVLSKFENYYIKSNSYKLIDCDKYQMHAFCIKTSVLKDNSVSITENSYYTDVEFVLKGIKYSKSLSKYDSPIYIYTIGYDEQSISDDSFKKNIKQHFTVLENIITNDFAPMINDGNYTNYVKNVFINRIHEMVCKHYSILFKFKPNNVNKQQILDFDSWLKNISNKYYDFYNKVRLKRVIIFRKYNFLYPVIIFFVGIRSWIYKIYSNLFQ